MKLTLFLIIGIAAALLPPRAQAVVVGQIDTFQDGTTDGWFAGGLGLGQVPPIPPHVVATGGPAGAGDQFLEITGLGGTGAGSRIVAINGSQWAGDYLHSGVDGIAMDLKNLGQTDLTIRLLFEDPMMAPPLDEGVTTLGVFLPTGSGWTHAFFPVSPSSLTMVMGNANTVLANTILLRIIDSPTPGDAVSIAGVLGVDNINAVPEPATLAPVFGAVVWLLTRRRRIS
jgi:hypothetical protein